MPSKLKRRPAPPRFRVNYDAKDRNGKPLKNVPLVTISRRGLRKRIVAAATVLRIGLEKQALARQNWKGRYEEHEHLRILRNVPSVADIAVEIAQRVRAPEPKPDLPIELGRALVTPAA